MVRFGGSSVKYEQNFYQDKTLATSLCSSVNFKCFLTEFILLMIF